MPPSPGRPRQIPFDLALPIRFGAEDYVVGAANRQASDLVALWPQWPSPTALLVGPEGSGKSHLVSIWAERSGARTIAAADLGTVDPVALGSDAAVAVEDLGPGLDEARLFHLLNAAREAGRPVLMTAREEPGRWGPALADLASRLRAATPAFLAEPDDALLQAVLAKLFADRQIAVDPQVLRYMAERMERSYRAAAALVEAIDREALAAKTPIGRGLAARVIAAGFSREPELPGLDEYDGTRNNPS